VEFFQPLDYSTTIPLPLPNTDQRFGGLNNSIRNNTEVAVFLKIESLKTPIENGHSHSSFGTSNPP
jgi:hypothetical protein